jgi:hypothetical protein
MQRFGNVQDVALPELLVKVVQSTTGQTVAFSYGYQDHAEAFKRANGDHDRLEDLTTVKSDTIIGHTIAVHPDHRHRQPIYCLMHECTKQSILLLNHQRKSVITALVKDDGSSNFMDLATSPTRRYTVFQYVE